MKDLALAKDSKRRLLAVAAAAIEWREAERALDVDPRSANGAEARSRWGNAEKELRRTVDELREALNFGAKEHV